MKDCLFCSIAASPDKLIWENDIAAAFKDIHPKARVHVLLVPKMHIKNLDSLDDPVLAGKLMMAVREVIKNLTLRKLMKSSYKGLSLTICTSTL